MLGSETSPSRRWLLPIALGWSLMVLLWGVVTQGAAIALSPIYGLHDPRVGPAALGGFVAHAILCGSDKRRTWVLRIGFVLEVFRFAAVVSRGVSFDSALLSIGYGFFTAAFVDFLMHREWRFAALASLVPLGMVNAAFGLSGIVRRLTPLTYDGALYALDGSFRFPFSEIAGKSFTAFPAIAVLCLFAYALLPAAIAAGLGFEELNFRRRASRGVGVNLLLAYTVSGSLAALLYIISPGTGPAHAFAGAFPANLPDPFSVPLGLSEFAPNSPRNAMPSFHVAWAIIIARSLAGSRWSLRATAIAFASLTAIATIGSGEHYVVDLIAALPFLVSLEAAAAHRMIPIRKRWTRVAVGVVLFSAWIVLVKGASGFVPFLAEHSAAMWAFTAATLGICFVVALPSIVETKEKRRSERVAPALSV